MKAVRFFVISTLLSVSCMQAARVTLPSKEVLEERFAHKGLADFCKQSRILTLAGQTIETEDVGAYVQGAQLAYMTFNQKRKFPKELVNDLTIMVMNSKAKIFEALLKDYPDVLKELQDIGLYTPNK